MVAVCIFIYQPPTESVYESILAALQQNYPSFEIYILLINPIDCGREQYLEKFCNGLPNVYFLNTHHLKRWQGSTYKLFREGLYQNAEYLFALSGGCIIGEGCLNSAIHTMNKSDLALVQFAPTYWGTYQQEPNATQDSTYNLCTYILNLEALSAVEEWSAAIIPDWKELSLNLELAGHKVSMIG